ncbi:unnamed protein product [Leptidea sinapis]|uniref:Uncharacterized protein n=1 Tax=Leptidea sinapis TaxID=189913 RepID=A0A5E4PRR0_9NEOP|nr:unnamed protein product [Leptidea sinapis]
MLMPPLWSTHRMDLC